MSKKFAILILAILPLRLLASHLMGANLGYEYLGLQPNGKYLYMVKLTTYIDCSPTSEIPYGEYPLKVGVYEHNVSNPGGNKQLVDSLFLHKTDTTVYDPFLSSGCTVNANTCIIQVNYEGTVELAPSNAGYWLLYERCCRNVSIINLQPNQSAAYLSFIPPTDIVNSTPDFLFPPIPFVCVNDTVTIMNEATDLDGDSLVYRFSIPFNGHGSVFDPIPNLPSPELNWPVFEVDYVSGFNEVLPFYYFGSAGINTQDGMAHYYSTQQGAFVVGVAVDEYRNGVLLSTTKRDIQLLFLNCPNNNAPVLIENLQKEYFVTTGDTLCFPVTFQDPESDSVFLAAQGEIFGNSITDTPAVFVVDEILADQTSGTICWTIPCTQDTGWYEFEILSSDNGCLPLEEVENYRIYVTSPEMPDLLGPDSSCIGIDSVSYWVYPAEPWLYQWNISNGNIIQNFGDSVIVEWGNTANGLITVDVFTPLGCYVGTDSMVVDLLPLPIPGFTYDSLTVDCRGQWIEFTNTSLYANSYHWLFGNGYATTAVNPELAFPLGHVYWVQLTAYSNFGCEAILFDTITIEDIDGLLLFKQVNVITPNNDGVNDFLNFDLPVEFTECIQVAVYDRWGVLLFKSSGTDHIWDGKVNHQVVSPGTYYWIVNINGQKFSGFVEVFL